MLEQPKGADWIAVTDEDLPAAAALEWATVASCGGVVLFSGTVRDHSDGHPGVSELEYEAYLDYVVPALQAVADEARSRWPMIGKIALLHRVGRLTVGETSVVVVVSTPHRGEAFAAGSFAIDTLKATAPIWKREHWSGGASWVACDHEEQERRQEQPAPAKVPIS